MPESTDPSWWFLGTRNNPDTKLSLFTSGNQVEALVDGKSYMQKLYTLIADTGPGDYIFLAGWQLQHDLRLSGSATVLASFKAAAERKVTIRVLLSSHLLHKNSDTCRELSKLPSSVLTVLDARYGRLGSAHQKIVVISKSKVLHAFCGGIDLDYDRADDQTHSTDTGSAPGQRQAIDYPGGWHDVQAYVQGPAARDIDETFRERWRDPRVPAIVQYPTHIDMKQWPIDIFPVPPTPVVGKHHVQMLRTYNCQVGYPFAYRGEFTARAAFLKAISLATDYIYIEDQYFLSAEVSEALVSALKANAKLRVIVVVPREPAADQHTDRANYYQARAIRRIEKGVQGTPSASNFAFYELRNVKNSKYLGQQIYVHAKLMIVDDVWVEIGSMNCNIRSMTHDLEAAVAIVDGETEVTNLGPVCKFARSLRLRLWAEHLGLQESDPSIQDPQKAYYVWEARAGKPGVPAAFHMIPLNRSNFWGEGTWLGGIDPLGTCYGSPKIEAP